MLLTLASLVAHVDTVVDAGANIGLFSAVLGRLQPVYPWLQCVAFEADPITFQRLAENLTSPHQTCHNVALSDGEGNLEFVRGAVSHVTTTVDTATPYSLKDERFSVKCQRLDSFAVPGHRLMLKIDVEGQELKVLRGAERWFEERRCAVVYLDGYDQREEVQEFLRNRDFVFFDGRTLSKATDTTFSLLALQRSWLDRIQQKR